MADLSVFWMLIRARDSVWNNRQRPLRDRLDAAAILDRLAVMIEDGCEFSWEE